MNLLQSNNEVLLLSNQKLKDYVKKQDFINSDLKYRVEQLEKEMQNIIGSSNGFGGGTGRSAQY